MPLRPLADTVAIVRDWSFRKEIGYDEFSVLAENFPKAGKNTHFWKRFGFSVLEDG